jgi:hypothetical protein
MPGFLRGVAQRPTALAAGACLAWVLAQPAAAQLLPPPAAPVPVAEASALNLTQRGVPAEATAENGVLARERALAAGRRAAFQQMAAEAGITAPNLSDSQIEDMVSSIVIEQERTSPTRYSGRITVNFNAGRVRSALGGRVPGLPPVAGAPAAPGTPSAPGAGGPASNWVEAVATYRSMGEWLELMRRLKGAGPVASVDIQAIAVDAARLRLGLRAPAEIAAGDLAGLGVALVPAAGMRPGESWRLGLAGTF